MDKILVNCTRKKSSADWIDLHVLCITSKKVPISGMSSHRNRSLCVEFVRIQLWVSGKAGWVEPAASSGCCQNCWFVLRNLCSGDFVLLPLFSKSWEVLLEVVCCVLWAPAWAKEGGRAGRRGLGTACPMSEHPSTCFLCHSPSKLSLLFQALIETGLSKPCVLKGSLKQ